MEFISDFLNSKSLTAGQMILVSVIASVITVSLIPILKRLYGALEARINKLLKSAIERVKKYIRYKRGKFNFSDLVDIENKLKNGQAVSKTEMEAYNKATAQLAQSFKKIAGKISITKPRL